jgi:hypothetical protein
MKKKILLKVLELILGGGVTGIGTYLLNEYQNRDQTKAIIQALDKLSHNDLEVVNTFLDEKIEKNNKNKNK